MERSQAEQQLTHDWFCAFLDWVDREPGDRQRAVSGKPFAMVLVPLTLPLPFQVRHVVVCLDRRLLGGTSSALTVSETITRRYRVPDGEPGVSGKKPTTNRLQPTGTVCKLDVDQQA